jgi:alpha-tubulin suppressor-like RCC1 family protein
VFYGSNAYFVVTAAGTPDPVYQWRFNGTALAGQTSSSLTISNVDYPQAGIYMVMVSNFLGSVTSQVAQLSALTRPSPGITADATNVPLGGAITLYGDQWLSAGYAYQWQRGGWDIPGATNTSLVISNAHPADTTCYGYRFSTPAGAVSSGPVCLAVDRGNPVQFAGRRLTLEAGDSFGQATAWQWERNGVALPGLTNATLALDPLQGTDAGDYSVRVTDPAGQREVAVARLSVLPEPAPGSLAGWGTGLPTLPLIGDAVALSVGADHGLVVRADGSVIGFGSSGCGGTTIPATLSNAVAVSAGEANSMAMRNDGRVFFFGSCSCVPCSSPVIERVVAISMGEDHGVALLNDGTVGIAGAGAGPPAGLSNVVAVAAGYDHSVALKSDGTVVAWGDNARGQLNVPAGLNSVAAISAGGYHTLSLRSNGTVVAWGHNYSGQCNVPSGLAGVVAVRGGASHSLALKQDGTSVGWGANAEGQASMPSFGSAVVEFGAGATYGVAVVGGYSGPAILESPRSITNAVGSTAIFSVKARSTEGLSYQWRLAGTNLPGATASLLVLTNVTPEMEGFYSVVVWTSVGSCESYPAYLSVIPAVFLPFPSGVAGRVVAWGRNIYGETNVPAGLTNAVGISSGSCSLDSFAYCSDGRIVRWGGGVGLPATLTNLVAVSEGENYSLGLNANGTVAIWGLSDYTQLKTGLKGLCAISAGGPKYGLTTNGVATYLGSGTSLIPDVSNAVAVASGHGHFLVLLNNGTVTMAKNNYPYSDATLPPAGLSNMVAIAAGVDHCLALRSDGTVVGWGKNDLNQSSVPPGLSNVIAVAAAGNHSLALKGDRTVVAWGDSANGLNQTPASLTNVVAIACGWAHNVALQAGPVFTAMPGNVVSTFGSTVAFQAMAAANRAVAYQWHLDGVPIPGATGGLLTLTNAQEQQAGDYTIRATADGYSVFASARLSFGVPPMVVSGPENTWVFPGASALFQVGATNVTALRYQWFFGTQALPGETSSSLALTNVQPAQAGRYTVRVSTTGAMETNLTASLYVLSSRPMGKVIGWGNGSNIPPWLSGVVSIAAGDNHSLALRADGAVICWGNNAYGQTNVPAGLGDVVAIAGGGRHSLAIKSDGSMVGWGHNYNGQASPPGLTGARSVAGGNSFSTAVTREGSVIAWGNSYSGALNVPAGLSNAVSVAAGYAHGLALGSDGRVTGWGDDTAGQASLPSAISNAVAIAAGYFNSLVVRADGTVPAFGYSSLGQTNVPVGLSNVISIAVNSGRCLTATADGTVVGWGSNSGGQTVPPAGLSNVVQVAAGSSHSLALKETGCYIYQHPQSVTARSGTNVLLRVGAVGVSTLSYQWLFNGVVIPQATNSSLSLDNVQFTNIGNYSVVVASARGSESSVPAVLTVLSPPLITAQPQSQTNLSGTTASFSMTVTGTPPISLRWLRNGFNLAARTNATLILTDVTASDAGNYTLVAANLYGSAMSQVAQLVVNVPAGIALAPSNCVAVVGSNATFAVTPSGTPPFFYQWLRGAGLLPGETNSSLQLLSVQSDQATFYSVVVTNAFGSCTSPPALLTIVPRSPTILNQPVGLTIRFGSNGTFEVTAVGTLPLSYQWRLNGSTLPGATGSLLALAAVDLANQGEYRVAVSNEFGVVLSDPAMLTLKLPPNVFAWGSNQVGQVNVPDDLTNAVAIAAGDSHSLAIRADGTVVAWGDNSQGQCVVPAGLTNVTAVSAGSRQSLALRADGTLIGWGATNSYREATPPIPITNAVAIEAGSLHSLVLLADGTLVGWGYDVYGQSTPPADLSNVVALAAGFDHSVALLGNGLVVGWGNYYGEPVGLSNVVTLAAASQNFLALQAGGRIVSWGIYNYGQFTYAGPTNVAAIGAGGGFTPHFLAALSNGLVSIWGDNPGNVYTPPVGLSNVTAVAAGFSHNLALVRSPFLTLSPVSLTVPEGTTAVFKAAATAAGEEVRFQWQCNGTNLAGATGNTLMLQAVRMSDAGFYRLVASDRFGWVSSAPAQLTVIPRAPVIVQQPVGAAIAQGGTATFSVSALGAGALSYQWLFNGSPLASATGSSLTLSSAQPSSAGYYSVVVANAQGFTLSSNALLTLAVADIIIDNPQAFVVGPWLVSMASSSYGSNSLIAAQGFGDGSACFNTSVPRTGSYRVYEWHSAVASRSGSVPCRITFAGGVTPLLIDESVNAGTWNLCGTFYFSAAMAAQVTLSDGFPDAGRVVVADAIRFGYVPAPPLISQQPSGQTVAWGETASFIVGAGGAEPLAFQWRRNGVNIAGATTSALVLNSVRAYAAGSYAVLVTGPDGAALSQPALLQVAASALAARDAAGRLVLDWQGPGILQTATNVYGPYWDVPGVVPPFTNLISSDPQRFYRLRLVVARPLLAAEFKSGAVILSWPRAAVLQTSTNVSGPFLIVPGAASPYTDRLPPAPRRFFRLSY